MRNAKIAARDRKILLPSNAAQPASLGTKRAGPMPKRRLECPMSASQGRQEFVLRCIECVLLTFQDIYREASSSKKLGQGPQQFFPIRSCKFIDIDLVELLLECE